jgi:hypothetical protein
MLGAGLLAALLLCCGPIFDPDLPWHLSAGRQFFAAGAVPRADFLSQTMAGRPWVDFEWAAEALFYGIQRCGDGAALWLFKSAAFFALTLLFVLQLRLWKLPETWTGAAAAAFAAALFPAYGLRPEIFSMLFFSLEFYLLERRRLGLLRLGAVPLAALHAALYAAWVNLHAGFAMGLALCFCYGVGELFEKGRGPRRVSAFAFAAAGLLGTLINPYGYLIYGVLFDHWRHLGALSRLIIEWQPPNFSLSYLQDYWLLTLFSLAGLAAAAWGGVALPSEHLFCAVLIGLFASRTVRTTSFALLIVYPLGVLAWSKTVSPAWWPSRRRWALGAGLCLVLWRGVAAAGPRGLFMRPIPIAEQGPRRACSFLLAQKETLAALNLYNPYNMGGYLGYVLSPDYKVFMDGRYLFADLLDRTDQASRDPAAWRALMGDNAIGVAIQENNGLMLSTPAVPAGHPYSAYFWPRDEWAVVYWDSQAIIYVRRATTPPEWLARHEYRWLRPHDLRELGLYVVAGVVPFDGISAEIDRYAREIGDPEQTLILQHWRTEFAKGLASADSLRRPKQSSL